MAIATSTIAIAAVLASVAAAGVGTYAAVQQGKAADAQGKYNQKIAQNNATSAMQQAKFEADRIKKRNRLLRGKQRANYLKSGIDLSGSAEDVMMDSAIEGALDVAAAQYAGATQSQAYSTRGKLAAIQGTNAKRGSYYQAAGTLLSGVGSAASESAPLFD